MPVSNRSTAALLVITIASSSLTAYLPHSANAIAIKKAAALLYHLNKNYIHNINGTENA